MNKEILFPIGLPGSGKTTLVNESLDEWRYQLICPDDIRDAIQAPFERMAPIVKMVCDIQTRAFMERGLDIIVDATNLDLPLLRQYVIESKKYGYKTFTIVVDTPSSICRERRRNEIPDEVFDRMEPNLEIVKENNYLFLCDIFDSVEVYRQTENPYKPDWEVIK